MVPIHPGRILRRELQARRLSANALARALRVPSGRIVDILNGKRSVTAETALRLGRYFGTLRNSGSTCRHSTVWPLPCAMSATSWRARSRQPHDPAASGDSTSRLRSMCLRFPSTDRRPAQCPALPPPASNVERARLAWASGRNGSDLLADGYAAARPFRRPSGSALMARKSVRAGPLGFFAPRSLAHARTMLADTGRGESA
jgi:addiction module HigA family antidote